MSLKNPLSNPHSAIKPSLGKTEPQVTTLYTESSECLSMGNPKISNASPVKKRKLRILITDDDQFIVKSFANIINNVNTKNEYPTLDISYETCINGIDCLFKIYNDYNKGELFDLLFIDEEMPFMNGGVCINNLNILIGNKAINKIEIISISSLENEDIKNKMLLNGVKTFITKPIRRIDFKNLLNEYI